MNWNGTDDTLACLSSLQKVTVSHEVVVVDNGSKNRSTEDIPLFFPLVHFIRNKENFGYAEGNNIGIRYALGKGADFIFILNNDTVVDPDVLQGFLKRKAPIQGGKPHLMNRPNILDHLGGMS